MADLDSDAPDLAALVRRADPVCQRQLGRAAAIAALSAFGVDDPRVAAARGALDEGRFGSSAEAGDLEHLVMELDIEAWRHQAAGADQEYERWFERARAVSSLLAALREDSAEAAYYAAYEALAALEDPPALRRVLLATQTSDLVCDD